MCKMEINALKMYIGIFFSFNKKKILYDCIDELPHFSLL